MKTSEILIWSVLALLGVGLVYSTFPRVFPLVPTGPMISASEATELALGMLQKLEHELDPSTLRANILVDDPLDLALQAQWHELGPTAELLKKRSRGWFVSTGPPPGSGPPVELINSQWVHLGFDGSLLGLELKPAGPGPVLRESEAIERARLFLADLGYWPGNLLDPQITYQERRDHTRTHVYFPWATRPSPNLSGGLQVGFTDDKITRFRIESNLPEVVGLHNDRLIAGLRWLSIVFLGAFVAIRYFRFYDSGQVRVRRAQQIALVVGLAGLARFGVWSQSSWLLEGPIGQQIWLILLILGFVLLVALLAFLVWGVGEPLTRRRWSHKLASLEALLRGKWTNATVAKAALRGTSAGLLTAGLVVSATALLRPFGIYPFTAHLLGDLAIASPTTFTAIPGLAIMADYLTFTFPVLLAALCVVMPGIAGNLGRATVIGSVIAVCFLVRPPFLPTPILGSLVVLAICSALPVFLFLRFDLLSALLGHLFLYVTVRLMPLWTVDDFGQQLGAWLWTAICLSPLMISAPYLRSKEEFAYGFDPEQEIPADVLHRVTEQARRKVELETARRIQASILPQLPPSLGGFELAHVYLPSSEVGGDFYDAFSLSKTRVAVALGDVAGHGVSSGLIMALVRGALAVQVSYDPQPATVCEALNRLVQQAAGKRYLVTFCYAVLDSREQRLRWLTAGHPIYLLRKSGEVETLSSPGYPLGVRLDRPWEPQETTFGEGDVLFLCSDGIVEAQSPNGRPFGYERLAGCLKANAGRSAAEIREELLQELESFAGPAATADDRTVLIVGWLPAETRWVDLDRYTSTALPASALPLQTP